MLSELVADNRILIVDRAPFLRDALRRMLLAMGAMQVDTAATASRAVALCRMLNYDLVLADHDLGSGKNGQQVLEELRGEKLLRHVAGYMVITAETTRDVVLSTLDYQPDDYLAKPYPAHLLERRVKRLLKFKTRLHHVFNAIDHDDYPRAIEHARHYLAHDDEFRGNCLRILGQLHLACGELDAAQALYRQELARQSADWARMGLGKVLLAQRQWAEAEQLFLQLIDANYLYVEAYENLAALYVQQDQPERAQAILARAVLVSPRSLRRQLQYAQLCERNSHYDVAALAWREVIRIVRHSRHEGPDHHLALARNLSDFCELRNAFGDERLSGEAFKAIDFLRAKYRPYGDDLLQSLLIEGRLHYGKGNLEQGKLCLREANALYVQAPASYSAESRLEFAKSLSRAGDTEQARALLAEVVAEPGPDPALLARADKVLDEPVSQGGKRKIIELNHLGIERFRANDFVGARGAFALAHARFPRNVELNLNLLQALLKLIAQGEDSREREDWLAEAESCLHLIGELAREHPKYEVYRRLQQEVQELQRR